MLVSVIIPCYNEQENLKNLIANLESIDEGTCPVEYIIVNNGSTDHTADIIAEYQKVKLNKNIRFTTVPINKGYGYGIKQGLSIASGNYVGWIHADMQVKPKELEQFFDYIAKNDGKTLLLKGRRHNRRLIEHFFTTGQAVFSSILFGYKMRDVAAIPILFSRSVIKDIDYMPNDFAIDIYVYVEALKCGCEIKRFDVYMSKREKGASSWNKGLSSRIKQSKRIIADSLLIKKGEKIL